MQESAQMLGLMPNHFLHLCRPHMKGPDVPTHLQPWPDTYVVHSMPISTLSFP